MKVHVDRELCIGAGTCAVIAPKYFEMDEQGLARTIRTTVDPEDEEMIRQAEANCPVEAVVVER